MAHLTLSDLVENNLPSRKIKMHNLSVGEVFQWPVDPTGRSFYGPCVRVRLHPAFKAMLPSEYDNFWMVLSGRHVGEVFWADPFDEVLPVNK